MNDEYYKLKCPQCGKHFTCSRNWALFDRTKTFCSWRCLKAYRDNFEDERKSKLKIEIKLYVFDDGFAYNALEDDIDEIVRLERAHGELKTIKTWSSKRKCWVKERFE